MTYLKKHLTNTLLTCIFFAPSVAFPQESDFISFQIGWYGDFFEEITVDQLSSRSRGFQLPSYDINAFSLRSNYQQITAASVGFEYNTYIKSNTILRFGINLAMDRASQAIYEFGSWGSFDYHALTFVIESHELNVNVAYLKRKLLNERIAAHFGPEIVFGTTFDDDFFLRDFQEVQNTLQVTYFDAESSKLIRLGAIGGLLYQLNNPKWEVGLDVHVLKGWQFLKNFKNQSFDSVRVFASTSYSF